MAGFRFSVLIGVVVLFFSYDNWVSYFWLPQHVPASLKTAMSFLMGALHAVPALPPPVTDRTVAMAALFSVVHAFITVALGQGSSLVSKTECLVHPYGLDACEGLELFIVLFAVYLTVIFFVELFISIRTPKPEETAEDEAKKDK